MRISDWSSDVCSSDLQAQAVANAMDTARDIIDKRVNELGTREPTIIREGNDRVVVQVPGLENPAELKALIGKTARLEFRMVDRSEERRVGQEGVSTFRSRWAPCH